LNKTCALPSCDHLKKVFSGVNLEALTKFCKQPIYLNTPKDQRQYTKLHAMFHVHTYEYSRTEFTKVQNILINNLFSKLASPHTISDASQAIYWEYYHPIRWSLPLTEDKLLELIQSFLISLHSFINNQ